MSATVLLADDQPLLRMGFRMVLESQDDMVVIGEAADGLEALELTAELTPDVVLMDVRMPGMDGIEATRRIVDQGLPSRVLILTTFDLDEYVYEALKAGASGFILKNVPPAKLVDAVRTVADGEQLLAPAIIRRMIERYVRRPPTPESARMRLSALTARELDVLQLIARGLSNLEIAQSLFLSEATVKSHVNRVLSKLSLRDRTQAAVLAYEMGLIEPGNPPSNEP